MSWDGGHAEHDDHHLITHHHHRIRKRNKIIIAVGIVTLIVLVAVGVTLGIVLSRKHGSTNAATTTVKPTSTLEEKLTIAFYTGERTPPKKNSVAWLLQQLDGGKSPDSTQSVLLNVAQKWKDDLTSGKMTVSFTPYDKAAGQTSDSLTSYDAIQAYINNAYKNPATLGDTDNPSQALATKKYADSLTNKDPTASFLLFAPKIADYTGDTAKDDMGEAGKNLKAIADKTRKTVVAGAGLNAAQVGYYGLPKSFKVIADAWKSEDELGNIFSPPSDLSTSTQPATTTTLKELDLAKTVTIAFFSGKSAAITKDDTKQVLLDVITDWKSALTAGDVKVRFIRYADQVIDTSQLLTTADEATTYVNDAYNSLVDITGKDANQAEAVEEFLDKTKQATGLDSAGFLLFCAPLEAYKDKTGATDMQAAGKSLNDIAGLVATTAAAAADIPANQLQYNLGDGSKVTVFGNALSDSGDIAEKFVPGSKPKPPALDLGKTVTIAFFSGKTNAMTKDDTQQVILDVITDWKSALTAGDVKVRFIRYTDQVQDTSKTFTAADDATKFVTDAYNALTDMGGKDANQAGAASEFLTQSKQAANTASAGFLLFSAPLVAYKDKTGATDMQAAGKSLNDIAGLVATTAAAAADIPANQLQYNLGDGTKVTVFGNALSDSGDIAEKFVPGSKPKPPVLDLGKTVTIAFFSGKTNAMTKDATQQVILDVVTDWKTFLASGEVKVRFIRYTDQVQDTSTTFTSADDATKYVNDAYNALTDMGGKDATQAAAAAAFFDETKQATNVASAGFLLFAARLAAYKDNTGAADMQAAGKSLNDIAAAVANTAVAAADIPESQLHYYLGDGTKVTVFGDALGDSGDVAEKFVPGSKPKPPALDLGKTVTIAFFSGKTNAMTKDDTQQVILDVVADWKTFLVSGDVKVRFIRYTDQVQDTSKTFTTADDATKFVNDAYNALTDMGGKDASQAGAASEYLAQVKLAANTASAGFLLFSAPHSAYKDNAGADDMQAAGKSLNSIAAVMANTAVAAADIPASQLHYYLGDGSTVTVFGDAVSNPGDIAEKFVPGSNPTKPQTPLALTISFYTGTKDAKNDQQFKETKGLLSALVTFWTKAIKSGRLTLSFIRYDADLAASDTFSTVDAVNQYLNALAAPTVLAAEKEPSQSSAIQKFVDVATKVPNSAFLHLAAPEGDYVTNSAKDMTDSGSLLKTLSASLKHVTLAGVDISSDTLSKFGLTAADKVDVVAEAQQHAPEIANEFIPDSVPDLGKTVTIAFFSGKSNTIAKDDTQQVILDVVADWKSALTAGDVKVRFIRYTDQVLDTSKTFATADDATKFVNDAYNALADMGGKDASQAAAAAEFVDQAIHSTNADSAGFLLFAAPHAAYKDNTGATDMQAAGKSLNSIAVGVANTAVAAADIPASQLQYNLGDGTKVTVFGDAVSDPGDVAEKFVPGSKPSKPKTPLALTISFYTGTKDASKDQQFKDTKTLLSALVTFWTKAINSGRLTLSFIRYDADLVASDTLTTVDAVNQYLNALTTPTMLSAGKEPSQSAAIQKFVDVATKVPNSAFLHLAAPEGDYLTNAVKDMTDSGSLLKTLSASLKHVTLAGVDISRDVLSKFGLTATDKVDVIEQAQQHAPEIANGFIPDSVPDLAKTVTIAFFSGKSNTIAKDDTQQVILDVINDWTPALTASDVKVRFLRYADQVQDTSKTFTNADDATKFVNDAYNALTDIGGKDANQAAAAAEFLDQAVHSTNADSAGFLLFAAPLAAYKDNTGATDMQAAGKSLNSIAVGVATTAVAAADIPASQLQYKLGDGTKVTVFGDAVSDPGDVAEKFVPGSKPSKPKTPLALTISFYAGTKDASKDQQFKDTKGLLSALVTFWTKAINSGRLTLSFIRYDADLVASDTLTTVDAVNQYLNTLATPTVLATGKEPSQASAIRHFVGVATKVPNSAFLHLAAPEGDYLANAVSDMTDSGSQLKVLSASLKHVSLSGVDISKDVLSKFGLTATDKVDVVEQAQDHAAEIANEFIPSPELLTIAFYDGSRSGKPTNDPTQKVLLDLVAKWKQYLTSGELKISLIGYSSSAEGATPPSDDALALTKTITDAFKNPKKLADGANPSQAVAVQKYKEKAPATRDPLSKFILFSAPLTGGEYLEPSQAYADMAQAGQALGEVSAVLGKAGVAGVGLTDEDMKHYNLGDTLGIAVYANAATKEDQIANDFGPEPETKPAPPTAVDDVTIAFFAAKPAVGATSGKSFENLFYRRKRDSAPLPDDAILMNALVDDWSDALQAGKLKIVFLPYTDAASPPVITTTVKDAKDYIAATYAALGTLPTGKEPSQEAVAKAYQSQTATHETKSGFLLISAPLNAYSAQPKQLADMDAAGKVVKDVSTQANQLATVIAGSDLTADDIKGYGDVGSSVSTVPQAKLHPQEIADKFVPPPPERLTIAFYTGRRLPKAGKQGGSVLLRLLGVDAAPSPTKADEELLASVLIPLKDKIVDGRLKVSFIKYDSRPSQKTPDLDDLERISSYIIESYKNAVALGDGEDPRQQEAVAEFNTALSSDKSPSTASFLLIPPPRSEYSTTDALHADEFTTGVRISWTNAGRIAIAGASLDGRDVAEYSIPKENNKIHIFEDAAKHTQEISDLFDPTKPAGNLPKPPIPTKVQVTIAFYNGLKQAVGGSGGASEHDGGVIPVGVNPPALENTHQILKDIVARWTDQLRTGQLDVSFVRYADQAEEPKGFVGTDKTTIDQINAYIDESFTKPKGYVGTKDPSQQSALLKYEAGSITSTSSFLLVAPPMTEYSAATASSADLSAAGAELVKVRQKKVVTAVTGAELTEAQAVGYGLAVDSDISVFPEAAKNRDSKAIADYLVSQPPTRLVISFFLATRAGFETGNPAVNENLGKTKTLLTDLISGWRDALSQHKLVLSILTYGKTANNPSLWLTTFDDANSYVDKAFKNIPELAATENPDQEAALKEYNDDVYTKETFFETAEFLHLAPDTAVYDDPVNARANAIAAGVYLTGFAPQAGSSGVSVVGLGGTALTADEIDWYHFEKDSPVRTFASAVEASAIAAAFDPLAVPPVMPPIPEKPPQAAKQRLTIALYNGVKSAGATTLADTKTLLLSVVSYWRDALAAKDIEISFLNYADKTSTVPTNMGSANWLNSLDKVQNYINENIAAPTVLGAGIEPSQDSVVKAYSALLASEPDPQRYSFLLVAPPSADYATTAKTDRQAAGSDLNKLIEGKIALIGADLTTEQKTDYAVNAAVSAFVKADDQAVKAASFFVPPPKLESLTIAFSVAKGSTKASGAVFLDDMTQKLLKDVVKTASWTQGFTDGTLQITLLPYAATAQPPKGPFTKLADVTVAIDQAFAGLVPLKDGEVLSQKSAVDAYITASSADKYPSADSFLLLAPSDLAVYDPIAEAEKDFAATGKQLNAIAKVVGKAGVGGVTLSKAAVGGYSLDASVNSFPDATVDSIVKKFGPTPTSAGGDDGGPTGGNPGGGDPPGGKNPPGKGVPPVPNPQPDPDLCWWNE